MMITGLDQSLSVPDSVLKTSFKQIDDLVEKARADHSPDDLVQYINQLRVGQHVQGLALAKLLYAMKVYWKEFDIPEERVEDYVVVSTGLSLQTFRKYTDVWESVIVESQMNPDKFEPWLQKSLLSKPITTLMAIAPAAREGDLEEEDWENIARAPDHATVSQIVRKARGQQTNSATKLKIILHEEGSLVASRGDEYVHIGWLNVEENLSKTGKDAIARIVRAANVLEV
jgi:hypothetical protein